LGNTVVTHELTGKAVTQSERTFIEICDIGGWKHKKFTQISNAVLVMVRFLSFITFLCRGKFK